MATYADALIGYLKENGYPSDMVKQVTPISVRHLRNCSRVEVYNKEGYAIQAFVLMSDVNRQSHHVFPFYHEYDQKISGTKTKCNPSCSIAVKNNNGIWCFYDASDSRIKRSDEYIDYNDANIRFNTRKKGDPSIRVRQKTQRKCYGIAICFLIYLLLFILSEVDVLSLALPLTASVVSVMILAAFFILLPDLLPQIKGFSLFGFSFGTENY